MDCNDHTTKLLKEAFDTTDLYQILGVNNAADTALIKQSYRKLALKYHPDRINGDSKKFQALSAAHMILSDENKRKEYDETGGMNDQDNDQDFDSWYEYFRQMFPAISTKAIDEFASKYHHSEEEKNDIIELYQRFEGDLFLMFNYVMCSDDEEIEERICSIIDDFIKSEDLIVFPKYKKSKSKFLANKEKRLQSSLKESKKKSKSSTLSSSSTSSTTNTNASSELSLEQQILSKQQGRANAMASIFSKYADTADTNKSNKSGKKSKKASAAAMDDDDISEEAFQQARERLSTNTKTKNKK